MKSRGYVPVEDYEGLLADFRKLQDENNDLRHMLHQQESLIAELRAAPTLLMTGHSTGGWFKPPVSPKLSSFAKSRSGSAQSRRSFNSYHRASNISTLDEIEEELRRAQELRDKSYEEMVTTHDSPSQLSRLKNIVKRWDIEIEALKKRREDMITYC